MLDCAGGGMEEGRVRSLQCSGDGAWAMVAIEVIMRSVVILYVFWK